MQPESYPASELELERIQILAALIANNQQLRHIIRKAKPHMREAVYNAILPYLKFKATPYSLLKP
jgi:hypothetical protein